jgi:hypothetical protein
MIATWRWLSLQSFEQSKMWAMVFLDGLAKHGRNNKLPPKANVPHQITEVSIHSGFTFICFPGAQFTQSQAPWRWFVFFPMGNPAFK